MDDHRKADVCAKLVEALVYANRLWLPLHPDTPPLYQSGVVFQAELPGMTNWFADIPWTLREGSGHCVALTAWRIAELRERGENCTVCVDKWDSSDGLGVELHIFLKRANGRTEDPARLLGMP